MGWVLPQGQSIEIACGAFCAFFLTIEKKIDKNSNKYKERRNRKMSSYKKGMRYLALAEWLANVPAMSAKSTHYFFLGIRYLQQSSVE